MADPPPATPSLSADVPSPAPPNEAYFNRHVYQFALDAADPDAIPIFIRKTVHGRKTPYALAFIASAPPSANGKEVATSPAVLKMVSGLREMKEKPECRELMDKGVALIYLCSRPNAPGETVIECDDPDAAANVHYNFMDMVTNLITPHTELICYGQHAYNVIQRYGIPASMVPFELSMRDGLPLPGMENSTANWTH